MPSTGKRTRWCRIDAVGLGVCVTISLLWYLTTVNPLLAQRLRTAELRREIRDLQGQTDELRVAKASARQLLTAVRKDLDAGGVELDLAAHINKRIAMLTEFFAGCDLHIDDVQTGRVCRGLQCDLVPITFVGRGPYGQCIRFLHGLCGTFPDMSVLRIDLKGNPSPAAPPEQFQFEMFWYAAPDSAARDDEPTESPRFVASELGRLVE
ncbi:MAG: hypothetical protein ABFE01_04695 [Phycisphaerales bacterium]